MDNEIVMIVANNGGEVYEEGHSYRFSALKRSALNGELFNVPTFETCVDVEVTRVDKPRSPHYQPRKVITPGDLMDHFDILPAFMEVDLVCKVEKIKNTCLEVSDGRNRTAQFF